MEGLKNMILLRQNCTNSITYIRIGVNVVLRLTI